MNGSGFTPPSAIGSSFPGHTDNGVNIVIVDATNNTKYVCVSNVDDFPIRESEPVYLYIAGM